MKKALILFITSLLYFSSFAQFSFRVFPKEVGGDPYADTLLNTRAILLKAGVKVVNAYQTLPEVTKTFASKMVHLNGDGNIGRLSICFAKNKFSITTHCVDDTLLYDFAGRVISIKTTDNRGNNYPLWSTNYISDSELLYSSVETQEDDSLVSYQLYNKKGQLVKVRRIHGQQELENTLFYYNSDGLLDSTRSGYWGTFIFKRRKKGKGKLIEMENSFASFKWVYNKYGQCTESTYIVKYRPGVMHESGFKGDLKTEIKYFYNPDGTLSKVDTKRSDKPSFSMYYSYVK